MKHFVTLIFFYTFYSCSDSNLNDTDNASFDFVKQVGFQTGFVDFNGKIVSFEKDVFMGFINSNTYKKIVLHPIDNPTKTTKIDLSEIDRRGEKIMDYEIINRDTIIILSWYTNKLFFINERGEIWKE